MFDFEAWSGNVVRIIEELEQCEGNVEQAERYQEELKGLWDELLCEENDPYVRFLKQTTREVLNGKRAPSELDALMDEMRKKVLEH